MHLIINGDPMKDDLPADSWDYHKYEGAQWWFDNQHLFDSSPRSYQGKAVARIFASEYSAGAHDLNAALAEAAWMLGMERNGDLLIMASYAPLFVNVHFRKWAINAIHFDASRSIVTPSYHNQIMFSLAQADIVSGTQQLLHSQSSINEVTNKFAQSVSWAHIQPNSPSAQYGNRVFIIKVRDRETRCEASGDREVEERDRMAGETGEM